MPDVKIETKQHPSSRKKPRKGRMPDRNYTDRAKAGPRPWKTSGGAPMYSNPIATEA